MRVDVFDAHGSLVVDDVIVSAYNEDANIIGKDDTIAIALDSFGD